MPAKPQRRPVADDPDALRALRDELREATREAHGAVRDLDRLLGDYRKLTADVRLLIMGDAQEAANAELKRYGAHLQAEMNEKAADLNRAVDAAREHIVRALTVAELSITPEGRLAVHFKGGRFDADVDTDDVTDLDRIAARRLAEALQAKGRLGLADLIAGAAEVEVIAIEVPRG
jgi:hypothetical protein